MIERIAVHRINRFVSKGKLMEIAVQHKLVVISRVEIDANAKAAKR